MSKLEYIDRFTGKKESEKIYGEKLLTFFYGDDFLSKIFGAPFIHLYSRCSFFSWLYGYWQKHKWSKKKVAPFIANFGVDSSEFLDDPATFQSFNDFFIRKLKPEVRPIVQGDDVAIMPADGRYLFYQDIKKSDGFVVKGKWLNLEQLLNDKSLAEKYEDGSLVSARLCPTDYHRFHFACSGIPGPSRLINGYLYSVNPIAIKKNISIMTQNTRMVCEMATENFGKMLIIEIGATNVGTIVQTYQPNIFHSKGDEKGYFSFGGSSIILLFEPGRITFDQDLLSATRDGLEIRCLMGQSMGKTKKGQ